MAGIKLWAIIIGSALILSAITLYIVTAEKAKNKVEQLEERLQDREKKLEEALANAATNSQSFLECSLVNSKNAEEADKQKARADKALLRLAKLEGSTNVRIGEINHEASMARGKDTECRTLDAALPEWFVAGLRQPAS